MISKPMPLVFNFSLEYATRKVLEKDIGLKFNGIYQLLLGAPGINLLGIHKYNEGPLMVLMGRSI
jgi:hypothetical protein